MATKIKKSAISILFLVLFVKLDAFESLVEDVSPCKKVCRDTYTPHTYEKSGSEDCCNRGCRLYSMMEFVYDDVNKTQETCSLSCHEAYPKTDEFEACDLGCKNQQPFSFDIPQDLMGEHDDSLVSPFRYIHSLYSGMISHMVNQACVSWSVYMSDNDGAVVIVKSPAIHVVHISSGDEFNTASYPETNINSMDNSATPFLKSSQYKAQRNDDDILSLSARDLDSPDSAAEETSTDWLSCVAKKTGLPRLLLSWLLLMCSVVMIWLCLSAAVTSPDQKVSTEPKPQKLSINGDQEVIAQLLALGIKPSYPQEKIEASSLPVKIRVHRL